VSDRLGYGQGFRAYVTPPPRKIEGIEKAVPVRADALNQMVVDWWRERLPRAAREPAFVYLQYMETHWPYAPPVAVFDTDAVNNAYFLANTVSADDPRLEGLEPVYDAEVRAVDAGLAQLFQLLERERFL